MLRLHRAQRAGTLADALADVMRIPLADPFDREVIAVPARGVERWLNQRLSSALGAVTTDGIAANISFPSSAALVADVLATASGIDRDNDPWAPDHLVWTVLDVIDESLGLPWAAVLARHLGAGGERAAGNSHRHGRRYGTAAQVAELFRRYAANRPGMLVSWASGSDADETGQSLAVDLVWQAELWRRARERIGIPSPAERLQSACERLRLEPGLVDLPDRISIFGPTRLTTDQLHALDALAADREVHLWLPHPSAAMWDALAASADAASADRGSNSGAAHVRRADDTSALSVAHPLLASLSRDVRELQLRLARFEFVDIHHGTQSDSTTLLGRIQADIDRDLAPESCRPGPPTLTDSSIQIHACHGPPRQVEVLREALLHLFHDDPGLEPRDVLVMCPDVETYAPLIQAAFGQPLPAEGNAHGRGYELHPGHQLRVRLADRGLRQTNPVLDIAAAVLALADGRVTASEVLDLAARPPVRRLFGFGDDDLERLREWTTKSGVRWGISQRQRQAFGLGEVRQNTWNAAVDRILLGVTAEETESKWLGLALPLDDVDSNDIDLAGRLAELIDRLAVVLNDLQGPQSARAWTNALARAIDLLVDVDPDETWQVVMSQARASSSPPATA
jgi:exodeoxyribonuclease V gamma subunit